MLYGKQWLFKFRLKPRIVRNHMRITANKIKLLNSTTRSAYSSFASSSPPHYHHLHHLPHHSSPPHPPSLLLEWHFDQLVGHSLPVASVSRQISVHA